jgi:Tol biopolymer transport system component
MGTQHRLQVIRQIMRERTENEIMSVISNMSRRNPLKWISRVFRNGPLIVMSCLLITGGACSVSNYHTAKRTLVSSPPGFGMESFDLSPDGQHVLYSIAPLGSPPRLMWLYLYDFTTRKAWLLDRSWSYFLLPTLTPDGKAYLYMPKSPPDTIVKRELDSGHVTTLYSSPAPWKLEGGALSPDGTWLAVKEAVRESRTRMDWRMVLVNMATGEAKQILQKNGSLGFGTPQWAPNSARFGWGETQQESDSTVDTVLYVTEPGSSQVAQIPASGSAFRGCWAPDSRRLATFDIGPGREGIYIVDTDTRKVDELAKFGAGEFDFGGGCPWSPDGKSIAFATLAGTAGGERFTVKLVSPDTKQVSTLLGPIGEEVTILTWSPSGKHLLFIRGENSVDSVTVP